MKTDKVAGAQLVLFLNRNCCLMLAKKCYVWCGRHECWLSNPKQTQIQSFRPDIYITIKAGIDPERDRRFGSSCISNGCVMSLFPEFDALPETYRLWHASCGLMVRWIWRYDMSAKKDCLLVAFPEITEVKLFFQNFPAILADNCKLKPKQSCTVHFTVKAIAKQLTCIK